MVPRKGCLEPGKSPGEIALQEAWEEAGLVGVLAPGAGRPELLLRKGRLQQSHVTLYEMEVTAAAADWPESSFRDRVWVNCDQALARIQEAGLREMIRTGLSGRNAATDRPTVLTPG